MRFRFAANAWLRRVLIKSRLVTATWSMSALAHFADSSRTSPEVREVPILLQNSAIGGARQDGRKFLKGRVRRSAAIGQISFHWSPGLPTVRRHKGRAPAGGVRQVLQAGRGFVWWVAGGTRRVCPTGRAGAGGRAAES